MPSSVRTSARRVLPVVTLLALAACGGDDGGPRLTDELPFSASELRARAAQVAEVSDQAPIRALATSLFFSSSAVQRDAVGALAARVAQDLAGSRVVPAAPRALDAVRATRELGTPRAQVQSFPIEALGKTYVRNRTGDWVVDTLANGSPRPGAPPLGVRFMLQSSGVFGEPSGPPIGMLDVMPRGMTSTGLEYRAVARTLDGTIVLQYDSESSMTSSTASGQAIAGTRRIEMADAASARGLTSSSTAAFANVSTTTKIETRTLGESANFESTTIIRIDDATLRMVSSSTEEAGGTYRVYSNGALFAQMRVPGADDPFDGTEPTWYRGDGRTPLDMEDLGALYALYELQNSLPTLFLIDLGVQFWLMELAFPEMP